MFDAAILGLLTLARVQRQSHLRYLLYGWLVRFGVDEVFQFGLCKLADAHEGLSG